MLFLLANNKIDAQSSIRLIRSSPFVMQALNIDDQGKNSLEKAYLVTKFLSAGEAVGPVYQLVMEFNNSINCEKECNVDASTIKLSFPEMKVEDLEKVGFKKQCEKISFIKKIEISEETHPIARVVVSLSFKTDSTVVKIQKRTNPHTLTINCYEKNILKSI